MNTDTSVPKSAGDDPGENVLDILIIDDEEDNRQALERFLVSRGHRVQAAASGPAGLTLMEGRSFDLVITDMKMPGMDGLAVLAEAKRRCPDTEVALLTAHGDIESAVRAMKGGACDFLTKPLRPRELIAVLRHAARFRAVFREKEQYRERLDLLRTETEQQYGLGALVGESRAMDGVKDLVRRVAAATDLTSVLICGETGTGKEVVARAIHAASARAAKPFVSVDCTAITESLAESQLFGHSKGAFTDAKQEHKGLFEQAQGGVIFLDEIGDMSPSLQAKLLRTLEQRCIRRVGAEQEIPIDVRVLSATNRDLVQAGFRQDLYYRLNTLTIRLPPLRERAGDIELLAGHFLARYTNELHKPIAGFAPGVLALLTAYPFPGNVRELRNVVERAVLLCTGPEVGLADLQLDLPSAPTGAPPIAPTAETAGADPGLSRLVPGSDLNVAAIEQEALREALRRTGGNQAQAAVLLGVARTTLRRWIQSPENDTEA